MKARKCSSFPFWSIFTHNKFLLSWHFQDYFVQFKVFIFLFYCICKALDSYFLSFHKAQKFCFQKINFISSLFASTMLTTRRYNENYLVRLGNHIKKSKNLPTEGFIIFISIFILLCMCVLFFFEAMMS